MGWGGVDTKTQGRGCFRSLLGVCIFLLKAEGNNLRILSMGMVESDFSVRNKNVNSQYLLALIAFQAPCPVLYMGYLT